MSTAIQTHNITTPFLDSSISDIAISGNIRKLPYHPDQRAEFLHLHAETEVLLQKLYLENHRRQLCDAEITLSNEH